MLAPWNEYLSGSFRRMAGGFELVVMHDRDDGWCWYVTPPAGRHGDNADIASGQGCETADAARVAAEQWTHDFCQRALAALA